MKNRRVWLWITVAVIVIGIFWAIRYANTGGVSKPAVQLPPQANIQTGQRAPEFTAATNQGYFDLAKTDRPVFLEIFATWCPHCQRETAIIDHLYKQYKDRVAFVGVSGSNIGMDHVSAASEQDVLNFVQAFNVRYPVAFDGALEVSNEYLQGGFPTLVVIAHNKTLTYITSGETPYDTLNSAIKAAR